MSIRLIVARVRLAVLAALLLSTPLAAQNAKPDSSGAPKPAPAPAPARQTLPPATPGLNFSGVIFGSWNYQMPTTPNQLRNQNNNEFVVERAYLTFRMPAGEHTSIRITTDVFRSTDSSNNAYTIRAKYAYLQYESSKLSNGLVLAGRAGIIENVVVPYLENFWPRYLSQMAVERAGFFASADVGVGALVTFPDKRGEIYAHIVNGPGYTARERDRFKDFAIRVTYTPLMNEPAGSLLQTFTVLGWGYKGALASTFVNGGAGQIGPVGDALDRSRFGFFAGIRDPRLVLGAEFASRHDGADQGLNTLASPRIATTTRGRLYSAFTLVRPWAFSNVNHKSPFGLLARYDHVSPTVSADGFVTPPPPSTENSYHVLIGGAFVDISSRAQLALDYQESLASDNGVSSPPPAQLKAWYAHFNVNF
ncbi:MAG TPA: hypothetical protein VFW03_03545 [Gemmatimonadaceae bacterium]|nr:hypothetical protein [Gemmatimonadaceae bacterium]